MLDCPNTASRPGHSHAACHAILQSYLPSPHATRPTGAAVAETSFYDTLSTLLNQVGAMLRPVVR